MISVSAPTDAALTMADRLGIALVGFARDQGFTIYTHPERIVFADADAIVPLTVKDAPAFGTRLAA
jgi:FdhD protein